MITSTTRYFIGAFLLAGFLTVSVILLWSDRAGLAVGLIDNFAAAFVRLFERQFGIVLAPTPEFPRQLDDIGHAILWASGMTLAGIVAGSRIGILRTAVIVALTSFAFELAQPLVSQRRAFEQSDLVANLWGVIIGMAIVVLLLRAQRKWWPQLA